MKNGRFTMLLFISAFKASCDRAELIKRILKDLKMKYGLNRLKKKWGISLKFITSHGKDQ